MLCIFFLFLLRAESCWLVGWRVAESCLGRDVAASRSAAAKLGCSSFLFLPLHSASLSPNYTLDWPHLTLIVPEKKEAPEIRCQK